MPAKPTVYKRNDVLIVEDEENESNISSTQSPKKYYKQMKMNMKNIGITSLSPQTKKQNEFQRIKAKLQNSFFKFGRLLHNNELKGPNIEHYSFKETRYDESEDEDDNEIDFIDDFDDGSDYVGRYYYDKGLKSTRKPINYNKTTHLTINIVDPEQNSGLETHLWFFTIVITLLIMVILLLIYFMMKLIKNIKPMTPPNINIGIMTKSLIQYAKPYPSSGTENIIISPQIGSNLKQRLKVLKEDKASSTSSSPKNKVHRIDQDDSIDVNDDPFMYNHTDAIPKDDEYEYVDLPSKALSDYSRNSNQISMVPKGLEQDNSPSKILKNADMSDILVNKEAVDNIEKSILLQRVISKDESMPLQDGKDPFSNLMEESFYNSTGNWNKYISPFLLKDNLLESNISQRNEKAELPLENGKFSKSFKDASEIGRGSFGRVWRCTHKLDNRLYAVKRIELEEFDEHEIMDSIVFREVTAMSGISHKNIVRFITCWLETQETELDESDELSNLSQPSLSRVRSKSYSDKNSESMLSLNDNYNQELGQHLDLSRVKDNVIDSMMNDDQFNFEICFEDGSFEQNVSRKEQVSIVPPRKCSQRSKKTFFLYIQMEYCSGMTLKDLIDDKQKVISRMDVFVIFCQILSGVSYIHKKGIIHRDLKPANIYLDGDASVKIGDFGLAMLARQSNLVRSLKQQTSFTGFTLEYSRQTGTPLYTAPEQEKSTFYNDRADVYTLGIILFEMLRSFTTFHQKVKEITRLKEHGEIDLEFEKRFGPETKIIRALTPLKIEARPKSSNIKKLPQFKEWIESLRMEINHLTGKKNRVVGKSPIKQKRASTVTSSLNN